MHSLGKMKSLLVLLIAATATAATPRVDQVARWKAAVVNPKNRIALDVAVSIYERNQYRYAAIAAMKPGTVPPQALFVIHLRESDCNFRCSPAQGDSLQRRSIHVPRGRIPDKEPPYTFEVSAYDSWFVVDRLDLKDWKHLQTALQAISDFNGSGYDRMGVPTPYLWSGTSVYKSGKYVADGRFSSTAVDQQLGCAAVLKWMQAKGIKISFLP